MTVEPIIAFFLLLTLKRVLSSTHPDPRWDKILRFGLYGVIVLFILEIFLPTQKLTPWIWHLLLLMTVGLINFNLKFFAARSIMLAILPFVLVSLFTDLVKLFVYDGSNVIRNYLDIATTFSIIWLVAMLIMSRKQRRALEKERQKTRAEEEQKIRMAERKAELEKVVEERTFDLKQQKEELEKTLVELKATQVQLIQKEKLASLGELTAGIAHEIKNPLNFVNNFSEVNTELIDELKNKISTGNIEEAIAIAEDIKANQAKINEHGKRADAIVQAMMQHSGVSTGQKEHVDLNYLITQYIELFESGITAKDGCFNLTIETCFDNDLANIDIVPHDIGRVLLHLLNNAFYFTKEKKKKLDGTFEPKVQITTKKQGDTVMISVKDNGIGIPEKLVNKIFQPFFTTKPAGQGTGLGLSLSYDIVKAHGGELKVDSKQGEYTEFTIELPLQQIYQ